MKVETFGAIESSWQWQQTSTTIVGLQGLNCKRLTPFQLLLMLLFLFISPPSFFVAPTLLFHNSTPTHTQRQKKDRKNKAKKRQRDHNNFK
jgi:hypothetical protein